MGNVKHHTLRSTTALVWVIAICGCRENATQKKEQAEAPIPVEIQIARDDVVEEHRKLGGDVTPWEVLPLSFKVGGRIERLLVDEGDRVRKGQTIAVLNQRDYQLMRDLADSQVRALKPHLGRAEKLLQEEALSQAQYDELTSKMEAARIQQSQAEAQLADARLSSPIQGVVIKKLVANGDLVGPTRPVAVIANLDTVKVTLPVTQRDLPIFKAGDQIELYSPGIERVFVGTVERIGYTADERTRLFPVVLKVANPDLELRAGMVVEAKVPVKQHQGIFVPLNSITSDPVGRPFLYVADKNGQRSVKREVSIGVLVGERVQIKSGLQNGDRVISRGMVQQGSLIRVMNPAEGSARAPSLETKTP